MVQRRSKRVLPAAVSRRRTTQRRGLWLLLALAAGVGAVSVALAQSGDSYSMNLNSPASFPVDI